MSEKVVQGQIVDLLTRLGAAVYVLGTTRRRGDHPGTMQTPGLPDLYAVLPTRIPAVVGYAADHPGTRQAVWIEVKAIGGRLRPAQRQFAAESSAARVAHVIGGIDDVILFLEEGGWLKRPRHSAVKSETRPDV